MQGSYTATVVISGNSSVLSLDLLDDGEGTLTGSGSHASGGFCLSQQFAVLGFYDADTMLVTLEFSDDNGTHALFNGSLSETANGAMEATGSFCLDGSGSCPADEGTAFIASGSGNCAALGTTHDGDWSSAQYIYIDLNNDEQTNIELTDFTYDGSQISGDIDIWGAPSGCISNNLPTFAAVDDRNVDFIYNPD